MNNAEIMQIALGQSAIDMNCGAEDFLKETNVIVKSAANAKARKYLDLPFDCNLVYYGNNIVASVGGDDVGEIVSKYISSYPAEHCFETPYLHVLNDGLQKIGLRVCFMAEYFLPDVNALKVIPCRFETKTLSPEQFGGLYLPQWSNALCEKRKTLDVLAVGAYCGGKLVGLAGCSADCDHMWQIGVDVLPEYRNKGIACALTSRIAAEIAERGKVPFYCAAWSNIKSVRNALKCGFRPAWTELTAKKKDFVGGLNLVK